MSALHKWLHSGDDAYAARQREIMDRECFDCVESFRQQQEAARQTFYEYIVFPFVRFLLKALLFAALIGLIIWFLFHAQGVA
jgi:hypothetical protein